MKSSYKERTQDINYIENASCNQKEDFVFERVRKLTKWSYLNIPFYKDFYDTKDFNPEQLSSFSDIAKIPIINKSILQSYNIEKRSFKNPDRYVVNTGGSTGKPLSIYISPDSIGHEWAHMHTIWNKLGFKQSDLKLTFAGRSHNRKFLEYDSVRHHFTLNIYQSLEKNKQKLVKLFQSRNIKYLHGYPSAIYEFSCFCLQRENQDLLELTRKRLKGVFLGSEFPQENWRKHIESTFGILSISWYGHTERAVLAWEKNEPYKYHTFLSYGYSEAIQQDDKHHLVATAYYNYSSPLIRYDTEDLIDPVAYDSTILESFKIAEGRIGEFILDSKGKKIPLTGLIYGRHHELFNRCKHIQVKQEIKGFAEILYVQIEGADTQNPKVLFDSSDVLINFSFRSIPEPIRSVSGKVKLLIK